MGFVSYPLLLILLLIDSQDIYSKNILWNHDSRRGLHLKVKPGQPAVPFQSTFKFCFPFIDFGSAVHFSPDAADHIVTAENIPPSQFAAPEQSQDKPYDISLPQMYSTWEEYFRLSSRRQRSKYVFKKCSLIFINCGCFRRRRAWQQSILQTSCLRIWICSNISLGMNLPFVQQQLKYLHL